MSKREGNGKDSRPISLFFQNIYKCRFGELKFLKPFFVFLVLKNTFLFKCGNPLPWYINMFTITIFNKFWEIILKDAGCKVPRIGKCRRKVKKSRFLKIWSTKSVAYCLPWRPYGLRPKECTIYRYCRNFWNWLFFLYAHQKLNRNDNKKL